MSDDTQTVDRCLCYTTDINYAFPTLLSAVQARANLSSRTDVVILLFDALSSDIKLLAEACKVENIVFRSFPYSSIENLTIDYARYFLDDLLDRRYKFVTHVDGDTHIVGTLDPLLDFNIAPGRVLAVPDPIAFIAGTTDRVWHFQRKRLHDIGLSVESARKYVNTGLFQTRRQDLASFSETCRTLALREGSRMYFGQQDAFNVALGPKIDLASLRWNYPVFFSNFSLKRFIEPRVCHFMSNPRPWQGPFPPWGPGGHAPYTHLMYRHPALAHLSSPLRGHKRIRYEFQQRLKRAIEPLLWDTAHIHQRILDNEAASIV